MLLDLSGLDKTRMTAEVSLSSVEKLEIILSSVPSTGHAWEIGTDYEYDVEIIPAREIIENSEIAGGKARERFIITGTKSEGRIHFVEKRSFEEEIVGEITLNVRFY